MAIGLSSDCMRMVPLSAVNCAPLPGLTHVYTLECNYNTSRVVNKLAHPHAPEGTDQNRSLSPQPPLRELHPKYEPVGKWCLIGLDCHYASSIQSAKPSTWHAVGKSLMASDWA